MELFAADGHDAGGCERVTGKSGMRPYDREMYKRRNEVERLFRRLKGYRRIFSRFEKLDVMFIGFIHFVLMFDALR